MTEIKIGQTWRRKTDGDKFTFEVIGVSGDDVWIRWGDGTPGTRDVATVLDRFNLVTPFFEKNVTYKHTYAGMRVTIHHVGQVGKHRFAAGLRTDGELYLFKEFDFPTWVAK